MTTLLDHALALAAAGFFVFPLEAGTKVPAIDAYPKRATRDQEQIRRWWTCPVMGTLRPYNIGISTDRWARRHSWARAGSVRRRATMSSGSQTARSTSLISCQSCAPVCR